MVGHRILPLLLVLAASPAPERLRYTVDPGASDVSARVAFFGLASKTAHFPKMSGSIALATDDPGAIDLAVELDATALTAPDSVTLGRLRGEKFFWVERYPMVRFSGRRMTLTSATAGIVQGEITARGVTRPATLAVTFATPPRTATGREPIELTARTTIDRRAFGMTAYSLIVGRKVAITIRARLVPA